MKRITLSTLSLFLGSALGALANVNVTFQVDMSAMVAGATFDPATQTMSARGSFNGWTSPVPLTNNLAGATPYVYSQTTNLPGNGTVMSYKYVIDQGPSGAQYENVVSGHNRLMSLPSANGSSITLPKVFFNDSDPTPETVSVTFQVDMAMQINTGAFDTNSSSIYARGLFNGWGTGGPMTNDPTILRTNQNGVVTSNVYVYAFDITGSPGQTMGYKYFIDTGGNWESPAAGTGDPADNNNRFYNLTEAATQTLPIVFFTDTPYAPVATNAVTFQVDMSAQILNGNFDPSSGYVELRGNFNSWGTPQILCTNNPSAPNTNIYSTVVPLVDGVGATEQYKFWATVPVNTGWETMADNRTMKIVSGTSQVLPVVYFSDVHIDDLLPADTLVTFTVNMTNAVGTDAHAFDPSVDSVYINGVPNGFGSWTTGLPMLTNFPVGSLLYQIQLDVPQYSPVIQTYKYSINGADNEAGGNQNHVRVVRTGGTYVMPLDKFGTQYVEPSFGQLAVARGTAGHVSVSWLGRPGVHLQTKADLSSGSWNDLLNTDGSTWTAGVASPNGLVSVTNYPSTSAKTFLRLVKPW